MGNLLNMSGGSLLGKVSLLPSGYKQLEYIENTSNAYIDTGVKLNGYSKVIGECQWNNESVSQGAIFGARSGGNTRAFYLMRATHNNNLGFLSPTYNKYYYDIATFPLRIEFIFDKNIFTYNEETVQVATNPVQFTCADNCYLFALIQDGTILEWSLRDINIYYIQIYADGINIVRNFIPCKNPNNVVGMYDTVNGVFYSSPNGTAFVAGPEV